MSTTPDDVRANDLAIQIALIELVRIAIAEVAYTDDSAKFFARLQALEEATVAGITGRTAWVGADEDANIYIKETASAFVSQLFTSIRHPSQNSGT